MSTDSDALLSFFVLNAKFQAAVTSLAPWQGVAFQTDYPPSALAARSGKLISQYRTLHTLLQADWKVTFDADTSQDGRHMVIVMTKDGLVKDTFYAPGGDDAPQCNHNDESTMTKEEAGTDPDVQATLSCQTCHKLFRDTRKGSTIDAPLLPQA